VTKAYSAKTARLNWLDAVAAIEAWGPIVTNVSVSDKTWRFDADGALTIPGDIKSEGNINIEINLADSTLRRWSFGEDGALTLPSTGKINNSDYEWTFGSDGVITLPNGAVIKDTAGYAVAFGRYAGNITQGAHAVAIGDSAGYTGQVAGAVAIGWQTGETTQGNSAVAIGNSAGKTSQGASAVAIGLYAGYTDQAANTIILNASGSAVNGVAAQTSSFYVAPIRTDATPGNVLYYNTTTKEVTYGTPIVPNGTKASTDTGTAGQTSYDSQYFYVCVATNSWRRMALGSY
jgi:hypothetical protein